MCAEQPLMRPNPTPPAKYHVSIKDRMGTVIMAFTSSSQAAINKVVRDGTGKSPKDVYVLVTDRDGAMLARKKFGFQRIDWWKETKEERGR